MWTTPRTTTLACLALTPLPRLVTLGLVMGVTRQAGRMSSGLGWPVVEDYAAEWSFWTTLSLRRQRRRGKRHRRLKESAFRGSLFLPMTLSQTYRSGGKEHLTWKHPNTALSGQTDLSISGWAA